MRRARVAGLTRPVRDHKKPKSAILSSETKSDIVVGVNQILRSSGQIEDGDVEMKDAVVPDKRLAFYSMPLKSFQDLIGSKRLDLAVTSAQQLLQAEMLLAELPISQSQPTDASHDIVEDQNSLLNLLDPAAEIDPFEVTEDEVRVMSHDGLLQQCRLLGVTADGSDQDLLDRIKKVTDASTSISASQEMLAQPLSLQTALSELLDGHLTRTDRLSAATYVMACQQLCEKVGALKLLPSLEVCSESLLEAIDAALVKLKVPAGTFRLQDFLLSWDPPVKAVHLPATASGVSFSHLTPRQVTSICMALEKALAGHTEMSNMDEIKALQSISEALRAVKDKDHALIFFAF